MSETKTVSVPWVRYRSIGFLRGRGISFGCSNDPIYPKAAIDGGKYSLNADVIKYPHIDICDLDFSIIANNSLDHVFIGSRENPPIRDLCSKLAIGGHCVIQAVDGAPDLVRAELTKLGLWQEKDVYQRDGCMLGIWKLLGRNKKGILPPKPKASKRACICRYGAIGDMIMISPLIRQLHEDGYEVTLNVTPYCAEVLKYNPYVSNIVLQERDAIPNGDLGEYWKEWMGDYDKYINLSESIEGKLLKVEGRRDFYTEKAWREKICGSVNYYDQTLRLGGYPDKLGCKGELYFSRHEEKQAQFVRGKFKDKFLILWAAKGSSYHKCYPLLGPVMNAWFAKHPDAHMFLAGGPADKEYAIDHPQVTNMFGEVNIRDIFCLTKYVDLVAGPETAITNAAGCWATRKLLLLSHSSHDNLCQYFDNHECLAPEVPCHPCHQLHYSKDGCPCVDIKDETGKVLGTYPACAAVGVSPDRLMASLDRAYNAWLSGPLLEQATASS